MNYARTFYIDDVLYTASQGHLKMNSFDDLNAKCSGIQKRLRENIPLI